MIGSFFFLALLQTQSIDLGGERLVVEIADTQETASKGLMGREHLGDGEGMLFVFETPACRSFWMKETLIPLSIGFFDEMQRLIEIIDMPVPQPGTQQLPLFKSSRPACFALEVPQLWFQRKNIRPGMKFSFLDRADPIE